MRRNFDIEYDVISDGKMPNVDLDWLDSEITDIFSPLRQKINFIYVAPGSIFVECTTPIKINLDYSCCCEDINESILYDIYGIIDRVSELEDILNQYSEYIKSSTIYIGSICSIFVYFKPQFSYSHLFVHESKGRNTNIILDSLLNTLTTELPLFMNNEIN